MLQDSFSDVDFGTTTWTCYFFRAFREKVWDAGQGIEVASRR